MDPDTRDYYERLLEMFGTPGWKEFIKAQQEASRQLKDTAYIGCETNDKWQYCRGQIFTMENLIKFEDSIRNSYDSLEQEATLAVESDEYDPLH